MNNLNQQSRSAEIEKMYAENFETADSQKAEETKNTKSASKGHHFFWTVLILVLLVVGGLAVVSITTNWDILGLKKMSGPVSLSNSTELGSEWQAVFLSNGQVYFGQLKNHDSDYPLL